MRSLGGDSLIDWHAGARDSVPVAIAT